MPTYEYRCPRGHVFEKFYPRIVGHRTMKCPTCGKRARRLISGGAGLVFKGSGFYITDYKRGAERTGGGGRDAKADERAGTPSTDSKAADHKPAPTRDAARKKDTGER